MAINTHPITSLFCRKSQPPLTFQIKPKLPDSSAEQGLTRHCPCAGSWPQCSTAQGLESTGPFPLVPPSITTLRSGPEPEAANWWSLGIFCLTSLLLA